MVDDAEAMEAVVIEDAPKASCILAERLPGPNLRTPFQLLGGGQGSPCRWVQELWMGPFTVPAMYLEG